MGNSNTKLEGFSALPRRVTWLLLLIVFPLIWVGGLVTTSDAGMAVPDWPNTYNYNMFAYPVRDWFFGPWDLFVEHGHRLLGSLAGIVSIALVIVTFWKEPRRSLRILSLAVLGLVIFQGVLGGLRVVLDQRVLAQIHGTVGPGFFCFVAMVAIFNGRWWMTIHAERSTESNVPQNYGLLMKLMTTTMFVASYVQLALGAAIRHTPEMASHKYFTFILVGHIVAAVAILLLGFAIFAMSRLSIGRRWGCRRTSIFLVFLVLIQVSLGLATWVMKYGWPVWFENFAPAAHFVIPEKTFWQMNIVTAHVAVGSLILATSAVLMVRNFRLFSSSPSSNPDPNIVSEPKPLAEGV